MLLFYYYWVNIPKVPFLTITCIFIFFDFSWYYSNTEIRLIIFYAGKDGEALYSQQKQDQELTVAQIMNFLLPNSDLN